MMSMHKYEATKEVGVVPKDTPKPRVNPDLHPKETMFCV